MDEVGTFEMPLEYGQLLTKKFSSIMYKGSEQINSLEPL
jgi:hypothetical protein